MPCSHQNADSPQGNTNQYLIIGILYASKITEPMYFNGASLKHVSKPFH